MLTRVVPFENEATHEDAHSTTATATHSLTRVSVPRAKRSTRSTLNSVGDGWESLQVSRTGQYSAQRVHELQVYVEHTSPLRCLAICVVTPLPSLVFVVLLECMPLPPPNNSLLSATVWVRMAIISLTLSFCYVMQFKQIIPSLPISAKLAVMISVCVTIGYMGFNALLALYWTFPIPFGSVITAIPFGCFLSVFTVLFVGVSRLRQLPGLHSQAQRLAKLLTIQATLVYTYPIYTAIFFMLDKAYQPFFLIIFPMIKLAAKNAMARCCVGTFIEDELPELVVFSVELFNSLYLTACVSMASEVWVVAIMVIALDTVNSVNAFRAIHRRWQDLERVTHRSTRESTSGISEKRSFWRSSRSFRAWSEDKPSDAEDIALRKLLFSCEYVILVEYIECFIPAICCVYTCILTTLPNVQYYPHVVSMESAGLREAVSWISLYIMFELCSLLVLAWFLWSELCVRPLYQLSFVLEHNMIVIQAKLFVWVTFSLTFTLEHSGMRLEELLSRLT